MNAKSIAQLDFELAPTSYRPVRYLSQGGMGILVEVEHRILGDRLALKLMLTQVANDAHQRERFMREAQATARVKHRNLVRVTDFGYTRSAEPFIVMELLTGASLAQYMRRVGPLPAAEAVEYIVQALAGLAAIHDRGIVHRDVKPANLFRCDPDEAGEVVVKVLDLGIMKVVALPGTAQPSFAPVMHTAEGAVVGTPAALSPEQAESLPVDARSDLYCAGVALYTLLAGRGPFSHHADAVSMLLAHAREAPPPLSAVLPGAVPPALEAAVMRAMAKSPAERFPSAREMAQALRAALVEPERTIRGDAPVLAVRPDDPTRPRAPEAGDAAPEPVQPLRADGTALACRIGRRYGGDYLITALIAEGGIGEVYEAIEEHTGRVVAIKVMARKHAHNAELRRRMEMEARALAALQDPHIVAIYRASVDPEVGLYIVMERLRGKSLRELMHWVGGPMPIEHALSIIIEICDATNVLHKVGVFHRDMKPENVFMLAKPTRDGRSKVLDLGASKDTAQKQKTTSQFNTVGTGPYMSPEHISGAKVTAASDQYSVGMMLYEMLAGQHCFGEGHHHPIPIFLWHTWHVHATPRPLTDRVPGFPEYVWRVVERAIQKEPADRYPSMPAFAVELSQAQERWENEQAAQKSSASGEISAEVLRRSGEQAASDARAAAESAAGRAVVVQRAQHEPAPSRRGQQPPEPTVLDAWIARGMSVPEAAASAAPRLAAAGTEVMSAAGLSAGAAADDAAGVDTPRYLILDRSSDPTLPFGSVLELVGRRFWVGTHVRAGVRIADPAAPPLAAVFEVRPDGALDVRTLDWEARKLPPESVVAAAPLTVVRDGETITLGQTVLRYVGREDSSLAAAARSLREGAQPVCTYCLGADLADTPGANESARRAAYTEWLSEHVPDAVISACFVVTRPGSGAGVATGAKLPIRGPRVFVGRDRVLDVCIADMTVSNLQALIVTGRKRHVLHNLSRTNPTEVNGAILAHRVLAHGDRIEIGETELVYRVAPVELDAQATKDGEEMSEVENTGPGAGPEGAAAGRFRYPLLLLEETRDPSLPAGSVVELAGTTFWLGWHHLAQVKVVGPRSKAMPARLALMPGEELELHLTNVGWDAAGLPPESLLGRAPLVVTHGGAIKSPVLTARFLAYADEEEFPLPDAPSGHVVALGDGASLEDSARALMMRTAQLPSADPERAPRLVVIDAPVAAPGSKPLVRGAEFALADWTTMIGAHEACDVPLGEPLAARLHAMIIVIARRHCLLDISGRGFELNGLQCVDRDLQHGDRIQIGATLLGYVEGATGPLSNTFTLPELAGGAVAPAASPAVPAPAPEPQKKSGPVADSTLPSAAVPHRTPDAGATEQPGKGGILGWLRGKKPEGEGR